MEQARGPRGQQATALRHVLLMAAAAVVLMWCSALPVRTQVTWLQPFGPSFVVTSLSVVNATNVTSSHVYVAGYYGAAVVPFNQTAQTFYNVTANAYLFGTGGSGTPPPPQPANPYFAAVGLNPILPGFGGVSDAFVARVDGDGFVMWTYGTGTPQDGDRVTCVEALAPYDGSDDVVWATVAAYTPGAGTYPVVLADHSGLTMTWTDPTPPSANAPTTFSVVSRAPGKPIAMTASGTTQATLWYDWTVTISGVVNAMAVFTGSPVRVFVAGMFQGNSACVGGSNAGRGAGCQAMMYNAWPAPTSNSFLACLHAGSGAVLWARESGAESTTAPNALTVDAAGASFYAGTYTDTTLYGQTALLGSGTPQSMLVSTPLSGSGAGFGARTVPGLPFLTAGQTYVNGLLFRPDGTFWVAGAFDGPALEFGGQTSALLNADPTGGTRDTFVAHGRYNRTSDGKAVGVVYLMALRFGGSGNDAITTLHFDAASAGRASQDGLVMGGYYSSPSIALGGYTLHNKAGVPQTDAASTSVCGAAQTTTLSVARSCSSFVARLNGATGTMDWALTLQGGQNNDAPNAAAAVSAQTGSDAVVRAVGDSSGAAVLVMQFAASAPYSPPAAGNATANATHVVAAPAIANATRDAARDRGVSVLTKLAPITCPFGYYRAVLGSNCTACSAGTFSTTSGASTCDSCQIASYTNAPGQSACTTCAPGSSAIPHVGATTCITCPYGKVGSKAGARNCTDCSEGSYMNDQGGTACLLCAVGTYTPFTTQAACQSCAAGYSQAAVGSTTCAFCEAGKSSNAASADCPLTCVHCSGIADSPCDTGYTGLLCSACSANFYPGSGGLVCYACPGTALLALAVLGFIALLIALVLVIVDLPPETYTRFQILTGFAQLVVLTAALVVLWPESVVFMRRILGYVTTDLVNAVHPECVTNLDLFGRIQWGCIYVPLLMFGMLFALWCTTKWPIRDLCCSPYRSFFDERKALSLKQAALLIAFLMIPYQISLIAPSFQCQTDINGLRTLVADPSIDCTSSRYNEMITTSIVLLLVLGTLLPFMLWWQLKLADKSMENMLEPQGAVGTDTFKRQMQTASTRSKGRSRFSFGYRALTTLDKYKVGNGWFEIAVLMRKSVTSAAVLVPSALGQAIISLIATFVYAVLLLRYRPFRVDHFQSSMVCFKNGAKFYTDVCNNLEILSVMAVGSSQIAAVVLAAMNPSPGSLPSEVIGVIFVALSGGVGLFLALSVWVRYRDPIEGPKSRRLAPDVSFGFCAVRTACCTAQRELEDAGAPRRVPQGSEDADPTAQFRVQPRSRCPCASPPVHPSPFADREWAQAVHDMGYFGRSSAEMNDGKWHADWQPDWSKVKTRLHQYDPDLLTPHIAAGIEDDDTAAGVRRRKGAGRCSVVRGGHAGAGGGADSGAAGYVPSVMAAPAPAPAPAGGPAVAAANPFDPSAPPALPQQSFGAAAAVDISPLAPPPGDGFAPAVAADAGADAALSGVAPSALVPAAFADVKAADHPLAVPPPPATPSDDAKYSGFAPTVFNATTPPSAVDAGVAAANAELAYNTLPFCQCLCNLNIRTCGTEADMIDDSEPTDPNEPRLAQSVGCCPGGGCCYCFACCGAGRRRRCCPVVDSVRHSTVLRRTDPMLNPNALDTVKGLAPDLCRQVVRLRAELVQGALDVLALDYRAKVFDGARSDPFGAWSWKEGLHPENEVPRIKALIYDLAVQIWHKTRLLTNEIDKVRQVTKQRFDELYLARRGLAAAAHKAIKANTPKVSNASAAAGAGGGGSPKLSPLSGGGAAVSDMAALAVGALELAHSRPGAEELRMANLLLGIDALRAAVILTADIVTRFLVAAHEHALQLGGARSGYALMEARDTRCIDVSVFVAFGLELWRYEQLLVSPLTTEHLKTLQSDTSDTDAAKVMERLNRPHYRAPRACLEMFHALDAKDDGMRMTCVDALKRWAHTIPESGAGKLGGGGAAGGDADDGSAPGWFADLLPVVEHGFVQQDDAAATPKPADAKGDNGDDDDLFDDVADRKWRDSKVGRPDSKSEPSGAAAAGAAAAAPLKRRTSVLAEDEDDAAFIAAIADAAQMLAPAEPHPSTPVLTPGVPRKSVARMTEVRAAAAGGAAGDDNYRLMHDD